MSEFITFGETTAVFVPDGNAPARDQTAFGIRCSGSESNTAAGIRRLGHTSSWMGRIGDDEMGKYVLKAIRSEGVNTDFVTTDPLRKTGVTVVRTLRDYDPDDSSFHYRENSAACCYSHADINESAIKKAKILHITGITPILSSGNRETVYHAIYVALKNNIKVSFDPAVRKKLWNYNYTGLMRELCKFSDITLLTLGEAEHLYDTQSIEKLRDIMLKDDVKKIAAVKNKGGGGWILSSDEILKIDEYPYPQLDPLGAGDAFNSGFLCGILENQPLDICGKMGAVCARYGAYIDRPELDKILF